MRIAGLDAQTHLRFADWPGISFSNLSLSDFDFAGAQLVGCDFERALITDAFAQVELCKCNSYDAEDWKGYCRVCRKSDELSVGNDFPIGASFHSAPLLTAISLPANRSSDVRLLTQNQNYCSTLLGASRSTLDRANSRAPFSGSMSRYPEVSASQCWRGSMLGGARALSRRLADAGGRFLRVAAVVAGARSRRSAPGISLATTI